MAFSRGAAAAPALHRNRKKERTSMASMEKITVTETSLEYILDFCVNISRDMIVSGANIERVTISVAKIFAAYELTDTSIYVLSHFISLAARDHEGGYASRQVSIRSTGIELQRLKQLNRLCYAVVEDRPDPETLKDLLKMSNEVSDYPDVVVMLCRVGAMICLSLLFGGSWREVLCVIPVTVMMYYLTRLLQRPGLDNTVINALSMLIATTAVLLLIKTGISSNMPTILITISMMMVPGIPLVNAVRNLLCGNELNGILQLGKIVIETLALAVGIIVAFWFFRVDADSSDVVVTSLSSPIPVMILSFLTSIFLGVVFGIKYFDLIFAGLGGLLTRIVLITLSPLIGTRIILYAASAFVAALYSEILATKRKDPSTYFIYPAILPLVPGNLFYYTIAGIYAADAVMFRTYGVDCLFSAIGMSIGFVLSSIVAHYVRRVRLIKYLRSLIPVHPAQKKRKKR